LNRVLGPRVTLILRLDPKGAHVPVDRGQLEQVIMNLVLNARDALGDNSGAITVSTRRDEWSTMLRVADTGAGMAEDVRARMFEPYFSTRGGSGLGLANVQDIVTNASGAIDVMSALGVGTAVEVVFPLTRPAAGRAGSVP
jgi:signal transduction histidine kinase